MWSGDRQRDRKGGVETDSVIGKVEWRQCDRKGGVKTDSVIGKVEWRQAA